jgi:hypothetical protein
MKLDDESLLDAYLDGELDPTRRLAVEAALESSPRLAERLRDLTRARHLVADLTRPTAPFDVSSAVLARIEAEPPAWLRLRRLGWGRAAGSRVLALGGLLATAAVALLALNTGLVPEPGPRLAPKPAVVGPIVRVEVPAPGVRGSSPGPVADRRPAPEPERVASTSPTPAAPDQSPGHADEVERRRLADQEHLQRLLDRPEVRRVFLLVDTLDEGTLGRVGEAIGRSPLQEPEYGRISVAQGIVLDPKHPGEAVVFAVAASPRELHRLLGNLKRQFPDQPTQPGPVPAAVVTLLADVGQVAIVPGLPAAGVQPLPESLPGREVALRKPADAAPAEVRDVFTTPDGETIAEAVRPDRRPRRSADDRGLAASRHAADRPGRLQARADESRALSDERTTLLIWVARRTPALPSRRS